MKHFRLIRYSIIILLPFLMVLMIGINAHLGSAQQPTLYVGIDRNAPPIEFENKGEPDGFNIDIMDAVGEKLPYKIEYKFMDWTSVLGSIQNGSLDIMFATQIPERLPIYDFSTPIINITWRIVVREDVVGIAHINDLENRTVAAVKDFAEMVHLTENYPGIIIIPVDTTEEGIQMVSQGDVFAFFGQEHMIYYALQNHLNSGVKFIGESYPYQPMCITVKEGRVELLNQINSALDDMFKSGEYEDIYQKWYGFNIEQDNSNAELIRYVTYILSAVGIGIFLLVVWNYSLQHQVRTKTAEVIKTNKVYQTLIELLPYPAAIVDAQGNVNYINPKVKDLLKYSLEEINTAEKWMNTIFPDLTYREFVIQRLTEARKSESLGRVPVDEFTFRTKDGRDLRFQFQQIFFEGGKSFIIMNDMSEHYQLENELIRKQKLESLSVMAGGLAHDFNNLLMGIMGNINLIQLEDNIPPEILKLLENVEKSIFRAKSITSQLLTFSKGGTPVKKPTAIEQLIRDAVDFSIRGSNCKAELEIETKLPLVNIDEGQITQVINNLIVNGIQAMSKGGTIQIKIESKILDLNNEYNLPAKEYLLITVKDQGTGIPIQYLDRIFTPYFTTKSKGTGLGLAMSYSIIKNHEGIISFKTRVGKGTSFFVYLPTVKEKETPITIETQNGKLYSGKVLVLEDDLEITKVLTTMLTKMGLDVISTTDGNSAIGVYQKAIESDNPFKFVILDLTIPGGLGGLKTLDYLKQMNPEIIAVVSSGYSEDPALSNYREFGFKAALKKPYNFQELIKTIQTIFSE